MNVYPKIWLWRQLPYCVRLTQKISGKHEERELGMLIPTLQQEELALLIHKERLANAERAMRHAHAQPARNPQRLVWLQRLLQRAHIVAQPTVNIERIGPASRQQTV